MTVGTSYLFEDESKFILPNGKVAGSLPKPGRIKIGRLGLHLDIPYVSNSSVSSDNPIYKNPHGITGEVLENLGKRTEQSR